MSKTIKITLTENEHKEVKEWADGVPISPLVKRELMRWIRSCEGPHRVPRGPSQGTTMALTGYHEGPSCEHPSGPGPSEGPPRALRGPSGSSGTEIALQSPQKEEEKKEEGEPPPSSADQSSLFSDLTERESDVVDALRTSDWHGAKLSSSYTFESFAKKLCKMFPDIDVAQTVHSAAITQAEYADKGKPKKQLAAYLRNFCKNETKIPPWERDSADSHAQTDTSPSKPKEYPIGDVRRELKLDD